MPAGRAGAEPARDFIAEARLFYQAVACAEDGTDDKTLRKEGTPERPDDKTLRKEGTPERRDDKTLRKEGTPERPDNAPALPAESGLDAGVVRAHCRELRPEIAEFRQRFVSKAGPFLARHLPGDLPGVVIYPFGGGDLVSALVTYPKATEIDTISLEHPGDPGRLAGLPRAALQISLARYRLAITALLRNHDSASATLKTLERGPIPGQLAFFLQALVILDYEPVALVFFKLEPDGTLHYYSQSEIDAVADSKARRKSGTWTDTDYSIAFSNMELRLRKRGAGPDAPIIIHRHFAANLDNKHFTDSPLHAYLQGKGKIAAMTKAASYLLWNESFSAIRNYLLSNMQIMVSDSTGVPPGPARKAGFEQMTFGTFTGASLRALAIHQQAFRKLWRAQPYRPLRFRYGYRDAAGNPHLVITRPAGTSPQPPPQPQSPAQPGARP